MTDRRANPRVDVQVPGRILLPGGIMLTCRVRDLSRGGALLAFEKAEKLPEHFMMRIAASPVMRAVEVAWRKPGQLGVRFVECA